MATEKLKVFKNQGSTTSTAAIATIPIVTTGATEQAVVKNVSFTATDSIFPTSAYLKMGNTVLSVPTTATKDNIASASFGGTQIVDSGTSLDLVIEHEAVAGTTYLAKTNAFFFNKSSNQIIKLKNSTTNLVIPSTGETYADVASDIVDTTVVSTSACEATSAFSWLDSVSGEPRFARCFAGIVYTYNEAGTLLQTAAFGDGGIHGACTDGIYFYGKNPANNTDIKRILISTGAVVDSLTTSSPFMGQGHNQGRWTLYYDGHIYISPVSTSTVMYKINTTTGSLTSISIIAIGNYCAGGLITVTNDGIPYIVEYGVNSYQYINLETDTASGQITMAALSTSTEYGNVALEVSSGVVVFFYNTSHVWVDLNNSTVSVSSISNSTPGWGLLQNAFSNSNASSIANLPHHEQVRTLLPADTTYTLYADGVEITGV